MSDEHALLIPYLHREYRAGRLSPAQLMRRLTAVPDDEPRRNIWITRLDFEQVLPYLSALESESVDTRPLYGIPFVIKDNIDLAGIPTSAGCPQYTYIPARSATVVQRLIDAGAIPLGKTNLDQFATGLVGTRSPYGACRNSIDADYVAGGSSSGSAVAVALGLASFSLGTDTAGSGRIPAAFNNIIGLKPTLGRLSATGVVPACRSLDTVSIFTLTAGDATLVLDAAEGFDAADAYARRLGDAVLAGKRCGIPRPDQLQFFGDKDYGRLFDTAMQQLQSLGFTPVTIDLTPFLETARLLYEGPWVAERYAAVGEFVENNPSAVLEVTRQIILGGSLLTAGAAFRGQYQLMALARACEAQWAAMDLLVLPTAATIYTVAAVEADPLRLNSNLGLYTNFVNLLDLAAVSVPAGFRTDGLPFGVSLVGPSSSERALLAVANRLHRACVTRLGANAQPLQPLDVEPRAATVPRQGYTAVAVCGAHMQGLPLNHQLLERGAYFLRTARTASRYRLFALAGGPPQRPGLIRVPDAGTFIQLEIWAIPQAQLGSFMTTIPAPLGLGTLELDDSGSCIGFICEGYAAQTATDISSFGGWRGYLAAGGAGGTGWTQPS